MDLGTQPDGAAFAFDASELVRHAVVLGASGSGKTGLVVRLVEELVAGGVCAIVLDPKGDLVGLSRGPLADRVRVFTPGSRVGTPLDLLATLAGPGDADAAADVVRGLLSLVDVDAGPLDPPALVLGAVVEAAWAAGERLRLEDLVVRLVDPPFAKLGAFPVDTVLPRAQRLALAVKLNGWLASPRLAAWGEGEPVDPDRWVARPGVVVITLAHLEDALRSLAASWVLSRIVAWSRRQPGSERLRLAVVLDEAWGACPPAPRDPPPKRPLLTLAKQGRAVGVGLVTATQNPVDLDYAVLSNAATWFVGRLATPQDREKVSDGASPTARAWLADLAPRTFLVRRAGREERLRTADCLTPLTGPVTLAELGATRVASPPPPAPAEAGLLPSPPRTGLPQRFLDPDVAFSPAWAAITGPSARLARPDGRTIWAPALLCRLALRFDEGRTVVAEREELRLRFPPDAAAVEPPGDEALLDAAEGGFVPFEPPAAALLERLGRELVDDVFRSEVALQLVHAGTGLRSRVGEAREAFAARVRTAREDEADAAIRKLEASVRKDVARLEAKRAKLEQSLATKQADRQARTATEVVGAGEALLGLLFGRQRSLTPLVSRRTASAKASAAVSVAEDALRDLDRELYDREQALAAELEGLRAEHLADVDAIEEVRITLEREDVKVVGWSLLWIPVSRPL